MGYSLGYIIGAIGYLITGCIEIKNPNRGVAPLIVMNIVRFILLAGAMLLAGFLYYYQDIRLFNIFAVTVGYLVIVIFILIVTIKRKDR